jgi:hypothetical protein
VLIALVVLGALVAAALILLGQLVRPQETASPQATTPTVAAQTPIAAGGAGQWGVTYEYRFPRTTWTVGGHMYVMTASCPNLPSVGGSWTDRFDAGEQYPLFDGVAFLRPRGLSDQPLGGNALPGIHPDQTTGAALTLVFNSMEQAGAAYQDCEVTLAVDGGPPAVMPPHPPTSL